MNNQGELGKGCVAGASASGVSTPATSLPAEPRVMVVVANYGTRNDVYLRKVLDQFRAMPFRFDLHVLSNVPKNLGSGVTVHVGLPTPNPFSLPFGHRRLFAENLDNADYFIYCEDDTLVSEKNISAFLEVSKVLKADEIPGFLRIEHLSCGQLYMESAHGPYRWDPSSLVQRGAWTFADFTNPHSAFNMASRAQVLRAIDSKGFLVPPHVGRAGMLEAAATDIYTQCDMKRLICVSRLDDFLVPHLSNVNSCRWGLPYEEFLKQTQALQYIASNGGWRGSLFEVETRTPRGLWSKYLYERPDRTVLDRIPAGAKTVLSVGAGCGGTEELLAKEGKEVVAIPVDAVFGDCLRRRGITVVEGAFEKAIAAVKSPRFDVILMVDVLHLVPEPEDWLTLLKPLMNAGGTLLATVPRTFDPLRVVWYLRGEPATGFPKSYAESGLHRVTRRRLAKWFARAGMTGDIHATCNTPSRLGMLMKMKGLGDRMLADRFIVRATCPAVK